MEEMIMDATVMAVLHHLHYQTDYRQLIFLRIVQQIVLINVIIIGSNAALWNHHMILTNLILTFSYRSKKIFSILLLLLFFRVFSQQIIVLNNNNFPLTIKYKTNSIKVDSKEKKTISSTDINYLTIKYDNGKNESQLIPIFLNPDESLNLAIGNDKLIAFKGDKDNLHNLIINQQHYILYREIGKYQNVYSKKNTHELINYSELVLINYLDKIKALHTSANPNKEDKAYERIEKYAINDWIASLYLILTGTKKLDLRTKELILYYYNKYIKKDVDNYNCTYKIQYDIINDLAKYIQQINISLPKYPIIESTQDDLVNQYLPTSCQKYYFINNYNYLLRINSPKKEYYKTILKEKFNNE